MSGEPLLTVAGITCAYGGIVAVRDLSFEVGEAEIVALLGPNGAGKSTALRAISGMRRADRGQITFAGQRIERWPSDRIARAGIALVPEGRRLFTELSVEDNLRMGGIAVEGPDLDARIAEVCQTFPILAARRGQRAGTLSGGEQQQLAIARALVSRPRLLIIDEMSLGLSPMVVAQLYRTVREINQAGTAILLVEQQVALVVTIAERVYVMERGQVKEEGPAQSFRDAAKVTGSYLGDAPGDGGAAALNSEERVVELLYLPLKPGQARALQQLANDSGKSVAEVVADAVESYLQTSRPGPKPARSSAPRSPR
jgi:branched-chain amino acid transport system ATP-binding protein